MKIKDLARQMLAEKENRRYARGLAARKMSYEEWLCEQEVLWRGSGEEASSGRNDFVLICAAAGEMAGYAIKNIGRYFSGSTEMQLVYGDEDSLDAEGRRAEPWFKPDWSPDFLDSCLYFGSLVGVRRSLWEKMKAFYEREYPGEWERLFEELPKAPQAPDRSGTEIDGKASVQVSDGGQAEKDLAVEIFRARELKGYEKWLHSAVEEACAGECGAAGGSLPDDRPTAGSIADDNAAADSIRECRLTESSMADGKMLEWGLTDGSMADNTATDKVVAADSTARDGRGAVGNGTAMCGRILCHSRVIGHLSQILFHGFSAKQQEHFREMSSFLKIRRQELMTAFLDSIPSGERRAETLVSVIIPSRDQPGLLRECLEHVRIAGADIPCEAIVVDNGSSPQNRAKIEGILKEAEGALSNGAAIPVRYLYYPMEFNFSRMCNLGAAQAKGNLLLFLNDDLTLGDECIAEMAARAVRSCTGAVGVKLLYPSNGHIQHAGITNLPMGPVHKLQFWPDDKDYYGKANHSCRNVLAVTAACLMVEKEKFREAGGFSEELRVAFNDVDFCFRLYELGYHNVCLNEIYAYHHESYSRGADESAEKLARLLEERELLYRRHPGLEGADPYYSIHLNRVGLDTMIRPAFETAGNRIQRIDSPLELFDISNCRRDECLMIRVEDARNRVICGYGVVLGDNNACYEKNLLLERLDAGAIYGSSCCEQYRPDLEENLSDQVNVALSGFWMKLGVNAVPPGRYRVGMMACSRVTKTRLVNWSNRLIEV